MPKGVAFLALNLMLFSGVSVAAGYPERPITMIVPYAPGGSTDGLARVVAEKMGEVLKQTVVVENIGGVGGVIGIQRFLRAAPDGYTVMLGNMGTFTIANTLYPKMNFQPKTQLTPIGLVAEVPQMLAVSVASGFKDLPSLVTRMRDTSQPKLNLANGGPGGTSHIGSVYFTYVTQSQAEQIPYKGSGPAITDLMAGNVDITVDQTVTIIPASKSGRIVPLAIVGETRSPLMPEVPTFAEGGVPEFDFSVWNAIVGPQGMAPDQVKVLSDALSVVLSHPSIQAKLDSLAAVIPNAERRGPEELKRLIDRDVDRFAKLIQDANITVNE